MKTTPNTRSEIGLRVRNSWKPIMAIALGLVALWLWLINIAVLGILMLGEVRSLASRLERDTERAQALKYLWYGIIGLGFVSGSLWYTAWPGLAVYLVAGAFLNDTAALFAGRQWGGKFIKLPFAPKLSPNKTWEGAIGGTLASVLVALIVYAVATSTHAQTGWEWYDWVVFGIASSAGVILGDLAGSAIKRACGVKDSGLAFGPQGGWLDRFGSLFGSFLSAGLVILIRWSI